MIYKQINSGIVIGSIFERFNIDYSGFVSRVPNWIHRAMGEMNIFVSLINKTVPATVVNYKADLPETCKLLRGISYLGFRLPRVERINEGVDDDMPNLIHDKFKYELTNNGSIITSFESCDLGDLKFYIKEVPSELDSKTSLYFPLIPDDDTLLTALEWYILRRLLERGHKVGEFSLSKNNIYLNPAMAWDTWRKKAENSVGSIDPDEREQISRIKRTMIQDYNYYTGDAININSIN